MNEPKPVISRQPNSSQVLVRFAIRLTIVTAFASFSTHAFGIVFADLLVLSAIFCTLIGAMRRERIFSPVLTHWDEAAACALLGGLVVALF